MLYTMPCARQTLIRRVARATAVAVATATLVIACGGGGGSGGGGGGGGSGSSPDGNPEPVRKQRLSVTVAGRGTVSSAPAGLSCPAACDVEFARDTSLTLTATPAAGQVFAAWSGACSGNAAICTLAMSADSSVTATFGPAPVVGWGDELKLSADGASSPQVAIDAQGRMLAVWRQLQIATGQHRLWGSHYSAANAWSTPERLEDNSGSVDGLRVAIDRATGRGMLLWQQPSAAGTIDLWARPLNPATGWGSATKIEAASGSIGKSSIGLDASGNAVAVWSQIGPNTRFSIYANRYTPGVGWGAAQLIETNEVIGSIDGDPVVAVAPGGTAVAVWKRSSGTSGHLWTNRFAVATGWGTATELVSDGGSNQSIGLHDLALDANGNGMLVWGQADFVSGAGTWNSTVWFKRFVGGSWQGASTPVAAPVGSAQGLVSTPVLRMNATGTALVAWVRENRSLVAALAAPGAAFGDLATVRPNAASALTDLPTIAIDDAGNGLAAWTAGDLFVSRLAAGTGWSAPTLHEGYALGSSAPGLDMSERGNAALAWVQAIPSEGARILVRRFDSGR